MRLVLASLVLALVLPVAAFATDAPSPTAVAACQAEAVQLGKDAFVAKYGPTEPFGHCYAAHAGDAQPAPQPPVQDDPVTAACKDEYLKLGADAFKSKYGATEAFGACLTAHVAPREQEQPDDPAAAACKAEYAKLGADAFRAKYGATEPFGNCLNGEVKPKQPEKPQPKGDEGTASAASAMCIAALKSLGKDAFVAKYGPKEAMGACVKKALAKAKALVASCRASSGSSKDAFKACIAPGVGAPAPKQR
jgi:hypothetical protein